MPFKVIPNLALTQGRSFTSQILHTLWANDKYIDHARQAIDSQLESDGHRHNGLSTTTFEFTFTDYVRTVTNVNTKLDIEYGGGNIPFTALDGITVTAATRTLPNFALHLQNMINDAIEDSTGGVHVGQIEVKYLNPVTYAGNAYIGRFSIVHKGTTDTPHARKLNLKLATGVNSDKSLGPSIGFSKTDDLRGGLSYISHSGFFHGFLENRVIIGDGGKIGASGIKDGAAIATKYGTGILTNAKYQNGSIHGDNLEDGTVTGAKMGGPVIVGPINVGAASGDYTIPGSVVPAFTVAGVNMPNARWPNGSVFVVSSSPGDVYWTDVYFKIDHVAGASYDLTVYNADVENAIQCYGVFY